jgi:GR25 family glycosyltransferase involved in LPS biosynthesis
MTEEKSIFDPDVSLESVKMESVKVDPPKLEPVKVESVKLDPVKVESVKLESVKVEPRTELIKIETSFLDSTLDTIKDFFYPFDENIGNIVIVIITICIICYIMYELLKKEGFINKEHINFDDIDMYYINLDRAVKRKAEFERQSKQQGLDVKRHDAVDGRKVPNKIIDQVLGHPKSKHFKQSILVNDRRNIGHFGCFLSHIGVFQEFMKGDKPYCLIFEDDAEFKTENFKADVNRHMGNVPADWDIVLFGFHTADDLHDKKNQKTFLKDDIFHELEHWTGMQGYLINRKSCEKLLKKLIHPQWYLDWAIADLTAEGDFKVYAVFKPIVCQPACYTVKFDNPQLQMHYIQDCKYGGGMATTFSE